MLPCFVTFTTSSLFLLFSSILFYYPHPVSIFCNGRGRIRLFRDAMSSYIVNAKKISSHEASVENLLPLKYSFIRGVPIRKWNLGRKRQNTHSLPENEQEVHFSSSFFIGENEREYVDSALTPLKQEKSMTNI